jgi:transposase
VTVLVSRRSLVRAVCYAFDPGWVNASHLVSRVQQHCPESVQVRVPTLGPIRRGSLASVVRSIRGVADRPRHGVAVTGDNGLPGSDLSAFFSPCATNLSCAIGFLQSFRNIAVSRDTGGDRARLERWVRGATTPQRVVRRARIVLLSLQGLGADEIAARVGVSRPTVTLWIERFTRSGADALLHDAPGRGRHSSIDPSTLRDRLREAHLLNEHEQPTNLRRAAAFLNVSTSALWRALRKPTLQTRNASRKGRVR